MFKKKNSSISDFNIFMTDNPAYNIDNILENNQKIYNLSYSQYLRLHPKANKSMRRKCISRFYKNLLSN